jgi:DegV family protein with EDD domain
MPKQITEEFGITIIPDFIHFGEKSYRDEVELSRSDFYQRITNVSVIPKTASPSVGIFRQTYEHLAAQGVKEILSIHIHSGLSALAGTARLAAEAVETVKVTVVEVGQVAIGLGFLVHLAAQAIRQGRPLGEIMKILEEADSRTYTYAALDTMDFLKYSGRVPSLVVDIASLLKIKPLLLLHRGHIGMDRIRTSARSLELMIERVKKLGRLERLGVIHTHAAGRAKEFLEQVKSSFDFSEPIWLEEATPVLGVHVGPGAVGLVAVRAKT